MNLDKWWWWGVGALVLALGAAAFWDDEDAPEEAPPAVAAPSTGLPALPSHAASDVGSAAAQLGGGLDDAARLFDLGVAGHLTIDLDTKTALEMMRAELGPNPSAADLQRVEDSLRKGLPPAAAAQAIALMRNYINYSQAYAREMEKQEPPTSLAGMRALIDRAEALQRRHFDAATAKGLFGAQQAHSRYMLEVQALEADTQLSAIDKAQRMKRLRDQLPPEVVALDPAPPKEVFDMEQKVIALRQQGGSEAEVQRLREQVLGADSATAIAQMEQQKAQFDTRYNAYLQEKKTLAGVPAPAQIDALLAKHFPADDVAAARAYDRLQGR